MRLPRYAVVLGLAIAFLLGSTSGATQIFHSKRKFTALVFPQRTQNDYFLLVSDLRVNETVLNERGDQFFVLRSADGTFQVHFAYVAEVEFTRYVGVVSGDIARYEARVVLPAQGVRRGTIDLRVLSGFVGRTPWHDLLIARQDRGASLYRILFVG